MSSELQEMLKFEWPESFSPARITEHIIHLLLQRGTRIKLVGVRWKGALLRGVSCHQHKGFSVLLGQTWPLANSFTARATDYPKEQKYQAKTKHTARKSGNSLLSSDMTPGIQGGSIRLSPTMALPGFLPAHPGQGLQPDGFLIMTFYKTPNMGMNKLSSVMLQSHHGK